MAINDHDYDHDHDHDHDYGYDHGYDHDRGHGYDHDRGCSFGQNYAPSLNRVHDLAQSYVEIHVHEDQEAVWHWIEHWLNSTSLHEYWPQY